MNEEHKNFLIEWPEWNDEFPHDLKNVILRMYYQDYYQNYCQCGYNWGYTDDFIFYKGGLHHFCQKCRTHNPMTNEFAISHNIIEKIDTVFQELKTCGDPCFINSDKWYKIISNIIETGKSDKIYTPESPEPFWYIFKFKILEGINDNDILQYFDTTNIKHPSIFSIDNIFPIKQLDCVDNAMRQAFNQIPSIEMKTKETLDKEFTKFIKQCEYQENQTVIVKNNKITIKNGNKYKFISAFSTLFQELLQFYLPKYDITEIIQRLDIKINQIIIEFLCKNFVQNNIHIYFSIM